MCTTCKMWSGYFRLLRKYKGMKLYQIRHFHIQPPNGIGAKRLKYYVSVQRKFTFFKEQFTQLCFMWYCSLAHPALLSCKVKWILKFGLYVSEHIIILNLEQWYILKTENVHAGSKNGHWGVKAVHVFLSLKMMMNASPKCQNIVSLLVKIKYANF